MAIVVYLVLLIAGFLVIALVGAAGVSAILLGVEATTKIARLIGRAIGLCK
ncbi:MAG: hypothetical protein P4L50_03220 [Anaerolineaceae bacterium]|nr:hypothetical protein [Anaerolineaceae bacterium]